MHRAACVGALGWTRERMELMTPRERPVRSPRATFTRHTDLTRIGLPDPHHCDVIERTADDKSVGRCWFYLEDGRTCPRHGDIYLFETSKKATTQRED